MDRMRFTSRLTLQDIMYFLILYGQWNDSIAYHSFEKSAKDLIAFFSYEGKQYKLFAEDFGMRITKINNGIESNVPEVRPSADDWFCFMKSKYGKNYQNYYASIFDAKEVVLGESKFLSQISYSEMVSVIKQILSENENRFPKIEYSHLEINEVESFYSSERRFWISDSSTNLHFYLRISDTDIITPRLNPNPWIRYMSGRFGEKYMELYHKNFCSFIKPGVIPSFSEFPCKKNIS